MATRKKKLGLGPHVRDFIARNEKPIKIAHVAQLLSALLRRPVSRQAVGKHLTRMVDEKRARFVGRGEVVRIKR